MSTPEEKKAWDAYVNAYITQHGQGPMDKGAIVGLDGSSIWTTEDPNWLITKEEMMQVARVYKGEGSSFLIAGEKYLMTNPRGSRSLYGKKGKEGVLIVQTTQAMLVGHYPETSIQQQAAPVIEAFADQFISMGY